MSSILPGTFPESGSPPEELMPLSYERLVPILVGGLKALTERVAQLGNATLNSHGMGASI